MADYNRNIPQGVDNLSVSQGQILNNFDQLAILFDNDHFTWDNSVSANRGYHRQVTFKVPLSVDPSISGNDSQIYSKIISGVTQLFFANSSGANQLTGLPTTVGTNGSFTLPNGFIVKFGRFTIPSGNLITTVTFPGGAFPNNVLLVPVIGNTDANPSNGAGIKLSSVTLSTFQAHRTSTTFLEYPYICLGN